MPESAPFRVALYSPDRARLYDGRMPEHEGVGGGITARLSLVQALAALGHDVIAYVHCEAPLQHKGVSYVPLDAADRIDCDVLIAISTGGALTFAPLRSMRAQARLRIVWVQGVPKPADLETVAADYVYVASNFLRDVCATRWHVPDRQLFTCYNGIHQEYFESVEAEPPARDPFAIAYVGPPEKGLDACVQVLRRLRSRDERFHLDVFGGDPLWGRPHTSQSDEPGLRFKGLLGQRDLAAALFRYEYCLALQAMEEGFGIAVQEAKRAGAIVLASDVGAFGELIRSGADGYLVPEPHASAAAQDRAAALLFDLAADPARRARVRQRAVATPWSWDLAAQSWVAHWRAVLARDSHAPAAHARGPDDGRDEALDLPDGRHFLANGAYCPSVYPLSPMRERLGVGRPRQILIAGYYGHGNLGDEAILSVALEQLQRQDPDVLPVVASGDPALTARQHDVTAVDERDLPALQSAARGSERLILGGGGLFHDYHGVDDSTFFTARHWGLTYCAALPVLGALNNTPTSVIAAGVGPLSSEAGRQYTRLIFEHSASSSVRDEGSRAALAAAGMDTTGVTVTADPAFLLRQADPGLVMAALRRLAVPKGAPVVSVALRHWDTGVDAGEWQAAVAAALDRLIEQRRVHVLFVPFQSCSGVDAKTDDRDVAGRVHRRMQRGDAVTHDDSGLTPAMVQGIFAASTLVLAMRLHAVILAANAAVPFVALRYDDKVGHAADRLGLADFTINLATISPTILLDRLSAAIDRRDRFAAEYHQRLPEIRRAAAVTFTGIGATPDGERPARPSPLSAAVAALPADPATWAALVERARNASNDASAHGQSRPATWAIGPAFRSLARAVLPDGWRRVLRDAWQRRLLSREAFVFDRFKRARTRTYGLDLTRLRTPGESDLVSVVLPVFNGGPMLREAVDSVLNQTHARLELIIVNDGSTDETGDLADEYARRDPRVRVIHQDNRKLPAALSRGFDGARGEFLTWISADNRIKRTGLEALVACLRRHPRWDMTYGNLDLIGEDGAALTGSPHFESYQRPHGSEHVHLPASTAELNVRANNFIGAGFLYRNRVAFLLGDYDGRRFVLEDYDYWMRVNALLTLRHADVNEPVCDYRFHGSSLTSRWGEFGMLRARERMMVFDDFRRDFYLSPLVWIIERAVPDVADAIVVRARQAGHVVFDGTYLPNELPPLWAPTVFVRTTADPRATGLNRQNLPPNAFTVLVTTGSDLPSVLDDCWDLCMGIGQHEPVRLSGSHQGWLVAEDTDTLFHAIDIRAKTVHVNAIETLAESPETPALRASVVICTIDPGGRAIAAIDSVLAQNFPSTDFEVIVVNNAPEVSKIGAALNRRRDRIRIVSCPISGLSAARNAGAGAARGEYVCFLDDDAVARANWLSEICRAFDEHPGTGVVGGHIVLATPDPRPAALASGWESYWSHFVTRFTAYTEVESWREYPWGANWAARRTVLARIGGFRTQYGRHGADFWGGEELVAAALASRLGYRVAIAPGAVVDHQVDAARFQFAHVRDTMSMRHLVLHAAGRELYVPARPGLASTIGRLALHHVDRRLRSWRHVGREVAYRKSAQARLLAAQVQDLRARWRKQDGGG